MPTVEKTSGGQVYIRSVDRRFSIGDRADVTDQEAEYLVEERGDFDIVDELAEDDEMQTEAEDGADDDAEVSKTVPFHPGNHTNDEIAEKVADIEDKAALEAIRNLEVAHQNRTGATDAIDDRLDELAED